MLNDPTVSPLPRLLEVPHVAHRLGFCDEHVRRLIRTRALPAIRFGRVWRVDPVDLQAFVDAQRAASGAIGADRARARLHLQPLADGA